MLCLSDNEYRTSVEHSKWQRETPAGSPRSFEMMNRVKRIMSRPQVQSGFDAYFSAVQRPGRGGPTYSEAKRDFREYMRKYRF